MSQVIKFAVEDFHQFILDSSTETSFNGYGSLEEFLLYWLNEGTAVKSCAGDFQIFLGAVAVIFAEWHDHRFICLREEPDYKLAIPWRITRALKNLDQISEELLDPYNWQSVKFTLAEEEQMRRHHDLLARLGQLPEKPDPQATS